MSKLGWVLMILACLIAGGAIVATAASLALIIFLNPENFEDNSLTQVTQATENSDTRSSDFTDPIQMDKAGLQADEFLADSDQKLIGINIIE